jgi:hypothetical protein
VIAEPTTAQLLDAVRRDLEATVAPAVTDPVARRALDMSMLVLRSAAVRARHEIAWMLEEADAIEALGHDLRRRLGDRGPLAQALAAYDRAAAAVDDLADVHHRYACASELLARAAEAAYDAHDADAIRDVTALFEQRRRNQNAITGGFEAVGRG